MVNALSSRLQLKDELKATAKSNDLLRVKTRSRYVSEHWKFHKKEDVCQNTHRPSQNLFILSKKRRGFVLCGDEGASVPRVLSSFP